MLVRAIGSIKHITMWGWGRTSIRLGLVKWTSALETELLCSPPELRYLFNCDVEHFQTIAVTVMGEVWWPNVLTPVLVAFASECVSVPVQLHP